jgi:GTP-binding protein HflX
MWTHLSRQKGGIGLKGAGEKEIETDRRILRDKIAQLKNDLVDIDKQNALRRKNRGDMVRVGLVGYTNVGKSTIMNMLAKADILAENKLFATLDTTVRKVVFQNVPYLLSDTVGFIRKLPHHLVESFKSTLDEARESDILLHVVDASSPNFVNHIQVVKETLKDINITDKVVITVFNKIDLLSDDERDRLRDTFHAKEYAPAVFISASQREGVEALRDLLFEEVVRCYREKYPNQAERALRELDYYMMLKEQLKQDSLKAPAAEEA